MTLALDLIRKTAAWMEGAAKRYGIGDRSIRALDVVDVGFEVARFTAIIR